MTNIARPIVLGIATTLLGAVFGLIPSFASVVDKVGADTAVSGGDVAIVLFFGACLAGSVAFGFFALRGQIDAQRVKTDVRNRSPRQINQGASVLPSGGGFSG